MGNNTRLVLLAFAFCLFSMTAAADITDGLIEYFGFDTPYEIGDDGNSIFWWNDSPAALDLGTYDHYAETSGDATDTGVSEENIIEEAKFGFGWASNEPDDVEEGWGGEWLEPKPQEPEDTAIWNPGQHPNGWTLAFWVQMLEQPLEKEGIVDISIWNEEYTGYDWKMGWAIWFSDTEADTKINFSIGDYEIGTANVRADFNLEEWHHVAATFNGSDEINVYFDGVRGTPFSNAAAMAEALGQTRDNVYFGFTSFDGSRWDYIDVGLDDIAVWTRELSAPNVSAIYAQGANGTSLLDVEYDPTVINDFFLY